MSRFFKNPLAIKFIYFQFIYESSSRYFYFFICLLIIYFFPFSHISFLNAHITYTFGSIVFFFLHPDFFCFSFIIIILFLLTSRLVLFSTQAEQVSQIFEITADTLLRLETILRLQRSVQVMRE